MGEGEGHRREKREVEKRERVSRGEGYRREKYRLREKCDGFTNITNRFKQLVNSNVCMILSFPRIYVLDLGEIYCLDGIEFEIMEFSQ